MSSVKRNRVPKKADAERFNREAGRTKAINAKPIPMRGGWRL